MPTVKETFDQMPSRFRPDRAGATNAVIQYEVSGEGGGAWHAVIKDGTCTVNEGAATGPNLTIQIDLKHSKSGNVRSVIIDGVSGKIGLQ